MIKKPNHSHYRQRAGETFQQMVARFRADLAHYHDANCMAKLTAIANTRQRRFTQAFGHLTLGEIVL